MCIFCQIAAGTAPSHKVYEDQHTVAFLDNHPATDGHTLIITRRHEPRLENLTPEETATLFQTLQRLVTPLQEAMDAPSSKILINNGPEAGQIIPHVHVHVIPAQSRTPTILHRVKPRTEDYFQKVAEKIRKELPPSPA